MSYRPALMALGVAACTLALGAATALPAAAQPVPAPEPVGQIRSADTPTAVPGSYIVVLKDSVTPRYRVSATARALAARHGGKVARTYTAALGGFEVQVDAAAAARLAADPAVAYVEQNQLVSIQETQVNPPSWGIDRTDQRARPLDGSYTYTGTAASVHAYVIDTGINLAHADFGGRAVSGLDAVDGGSADDCNGHGTHVAGTIGGTTYGVAKQAQLVAVRVLGCNGSGSNAGVIAGVDWVTANAIKPAVANMSLGGGANTTLDTAVRNSIASGVTYALAAGNSAANACNSSPSRVTQGLTVAASDRNDASASFTNRGTCVDLYAPGVAIASAWIGSTTASNTISGTSMAAPHVAGVAALVVAANPSLTPAQVNTAIVGATTSGVVTGVPASTPNLLLYNGS